MPCRRPREVELTMLERSRLLGALAVALLPSMGGGAPALGAEGPRAPTGTAAATAPSAAQAPPEADAGAGAAAADAGSLEAPGADGEGDLTELSLEDLMNVETTSTGRKAQKWSEVPAALYVITRDDVRRTGVRSLADALRFSPGVQVARIDGNKWAVGVRGFATRLSRSTLVLMDGRPVYSPLFAGTYWEAQDTLLEDLDRIEVIRGPGGAIYGANAVNGVINITTRSSKYTQGLFAMAGAGVYERGFADVRYGGEVAPELTYRVYGKGFDRDAMEHRTTDDFDAWEQGQAGFRFDWDATEKDVLTLQGDIYSGVVGMREDVPVYEPPSQVTLEEDGRLWGANVLSRWTRRMDEGLELQVQAFYDHTYRREPTFVEHRDTADIQIQQRFPLPLPLPQDLIVGVEYRISSGLDHTIETLAVDPERRTEDVVSGFIQDEVTIVPGVLKVTGGIKLEHNDYSGFEYHPSGRIAFTPAARHLVWASAARTVRVPSRVESDLSADIFGSAAPPIFGRLTGDGNFKPEELVAYECGYRFQPLDALALDLALFHNRYRDLLSGEIGVPFIESPPSGSPRFIVPILLRNGNEGQTDGVEVAADVAVADWWHLHGAYSFLYMDLTGQDANGARSTEGGSPANQVAIRSYVDLPRGFELDATFRFVDRLPAQDIDAYATVDARLAWRPSKSIEVSLVGQNLLERSHGEFRGEETSGVTGVPMIAYFAVSVKW